LLVFLLIGRCPQPMKSWLMLRRLGCEQR